MTIRDELVAIALADVGSSDWQAFQSRAAPCYPHGVRKSWCGIAVLDWLRRAGLTDWEWRDGKGFLYRIGWDQTTTRPEPGDIGYVDQPWSHHFMVESVVASVVNCIDPNSGPTPGQVMRRMRNLDDKRVVYFSIRKLVEAAVSDTTPAPPTSVPAPAASLVLIRIGSEGASVLAWQEFLDDWQYDGEPVLAPQRRSGHFDGYTYAATLAYQKAQRLKVDGIVGPITRAVAGIG